MERREFLKLGIIGGLMSTASWAEANNQNILKPTPPEIEGPFYPVVAQKDKDFDLTIIKGKTEKAKGKVIVIEGRVIDINGTPISDASVELWQANSAGRYNHPHDSNTAPLDPNYQGWAIVPSGKVGGFQFKTIYPGTYPAAKDWIRPPHIHFKVSKLGYIELITQMYFPGHELNEKDLLLKRKKVEERKLMVATRVKGSDEVYKYDIVLQKV